MTKAKQGEVVSTLPVGWIKGPDGQYDYDPETKDTIQMVIDTFWQNRSIRRTVKALAKAGVQIPSRDEESADLFQKTNLRACDKDPHKSRLCRNLRFWKNPIPAGRSRAG